MGSSKSSANQHYDYSTHEEYTNVQGGQLGVLGDITGSVNITDGGAVAAAAAVSSDAIRMAEASNLTALQTAAQLAGDSFGLVGGITDQFGKSSDQAMRLASEHARLSADNTKSALDFAKQIGRADGGASAEMMQYAALAAAGVMVVMILRSGK